MIATEEHEKRLELYNRGFSDDRMARELYLTKNAVYFWRKRNGLKANHPANTRKNIIPELCETMKEIRKSMGMSCKQFGDMLGISSTRVSLYENGYNTIPDSVVEQIKELEERLEMMKESTFTDDAVEKITELWRMGATDRVISELVGINPMAIYAFRKRNNFPYNERLATSKELRELFKEWRVSNGLSKKGAARLFGRSDTNCRDIEKGTLKINEDMMITILRWREQQNEDD